MVVSGTTPHVVFDFVLYSVCRYLKIPFRFFNRLPVVVGASTYLYCADSIDPLILNPAGYSSLEKVNHSHINAYLRLGQPRGSSTLTFDGVKKPDYYKYLRLFRVFRSLVIRLKMFNSFLRRPFSVRTTLIRLLDTRSKNFSRWSNIHDIGKFTRYAYFPLHHQPGAQLYLWEDFSAIKKLPSNLLEKYYLWIFRSLLSRTSVMETSGLISSYIANT